MLGEFTTEELIQELEARFDSCIFLGLRKNDEDKYFVEHYGEPMDCLALASRMVHILNNYCDNNEDDIEIEDI